MKWTSVATTIACAFCMAPAPAQESLFDVEGLDGELVLTGDALSNVSGGVRRGTRATGLIYAGVSLDTERLGWWNNGKWNVSSVAFASGNPTTGLVGDYQYLDNIDSPSTLRLYEAWYEHQWLDDSLSAKLGFQDLNREFDVLNTAAVFFNSSFGLQPDISQAGISTYPETTVALRLKYSSSKGYYVMGAVADGVPGNPGSVYGTRLSLRASDGQYAIVETGITRQPLNEAGEPDADAKPSSKLAFGAWYHTRDFEDPSGIPQDENAGLYLIGEHAFTDRLSAFFQYGAALPDRNQIAHYLGAGVNYRGLVPGRDDDILGLAVSHARNSNAFVRANNALQGETVVEMTYLVVVNDHFTLQPDLQYIADPGMDPANEDAWVFGARAQLSF